ncbi:NAD(P)-dependent oxidoreductase [Glaciihabitans arcticus]|uniref:NAD(P)-dependent oxidoreductase n=1 Tax=Glaciihabitans arcticus TaxID=2668039 RepID=A0A4Q9GV02_9MICO|nr:NAD(P)-dependent oxidoreductase [Glaciihabitans arcticus]TBN57448.1 NAD(P)-dependent oxidoreductase [Glaciihabitans arcticus]
MRVLLAGASGAIGRYLIPQLIAAGHEVTGTTRKRRALEFTGATELVTDVVDRQAFLELIEGFEFDAVIHALSSLARTPLTFVDMRETNRLRSEGTSTLLAAARLTGAKKFIFSSHVYGYGFRDHGSRILDEESPFGQLPGTRLDAVQKSLLSGEQQARAYGGVALRYGMLYRGRGPIRGIVRDWDGVLPFVHFDDAAAATVLALETGAPGSVYNIVDDEPVSWAELQRARAETFGRAEPNGQSSWFTHLAAPFAAQLTAETAMKVSNARAKADLGWKPLYPSYRDALTADKELVDHARAVVSGTASVLRST